MAVKKHGADTGQSAVNRRRRRRRMVEYLLVFVGCVLIVDAVVGDKGVVQMMKKHDESRMLEQALAQDRHDNAQLREQARRLKDDPKAIEELARRELGLIKPGEKLFIIRDVRPADVRPNDK